MKLINILKEAITEYKVSYTVLKDKDFSKGSAIYKNEADAKKFFDDMVNDEEVISAKLEKIFGADSSMDQLGGAAKYLGGSETMEYYSHPAAKGVSQGGKHSSELTPQELNIRTFLNSPSFFSKKKGFTNKDGSDRWFQEGKDSFSGYFSKTSLGQMIIDAEEILASGMQNGEPLDNETEMLVRQELERLKKLYVDNHGYTGMMASADPSLKKPDAKKEKVIKFLKKRGY